MSTFAKVFIMGRIGKAPVLEGTRTGKPFCRLNLATDGLPPRDGQGEKKTHWHIVHVFGKLAETAAKYLDKGGHVFIEGRLENTATDKNGTVVWRTWVTTERLTFVGSSGRKVAEPIEENAKVLVEEEQEQQIPEFSSLPAIEASPFENGHAH